MNKKRENNITWAAGILAIMIIFLGISLQDYTITNAQTTDTSKWAAAYLKQVKTIRKEAKKEGQTQPTYSLIHFDNDGIPELLVGISGYWVSMYTYKDGKVYLLMDNWPYGAFGNAGYEYIPKKNCLRNYNTDMAGAILYVNYEKIENHKLVSYYKKDLWCTNLVDTNGDGDYYDEVEYSDTWTYFYGKKEITEKKYQSLLIEGNYKSMEPRATYRSIVRNLQNRM